MPTPQPVANPFALMIDPQSVITQIERSVRLESLERRVCRPLDKPLIGKVDGESPEAFDHAVDQEADATDGDDRAA